MNNQEGSYTLHFNGMELEANPQNIIWETVGTIRSKLEELYNSTVEGLSKGITSFCKTCQEHEYITASALVFAFPIAGGYVIGITAVQLTNVYFIGNLSLYLGFPFAIVAAYPLAFAWGYSCGELYQTVMTYGR